MTRFHPAFAVLVVCLAIALRAFVPAGYMLDRSEETGALEIRICSGTNAEVMSFIPATGEWVSSVDQASDAETGREDMPSTDGICPFALALAVAHLPQVDIDLSAPLFGPPLLAGKVYIETSYLRPVSPTLPARGPPLHI